MRLSAEFQKYNPFRRPDWRFERVLTILDRGPSGRCSRRDDEWVRQARNFLLRWRSCEADRRDKVFAETPGLYHAYRIRESFQEDPVTSYMIQARMLAGQPVEIIADRQSMRPETVVWYEAMFFNVSDHLESRDWIASQVLAPAFRRCVGSEGGEPFMESTLKWLAYCGGANVVDSLLQHLKVGSPPRSVEEVSRWLDGQWSFLIRRRSLESACQFQTTPRNVMKLFATHASLIEMARKEDSNATDSQLQEHIAEFVKGVPWMSGAAGFSGPCDGGGPGPVSADTPRTAAPDRSGSNRLDAVSPTSCRSATGESKGLSDRLPSSVAHQLRAEEKMSSNWSPHQRPSNR